MTKAQLTAIQTVGAGLILTAVIIFFKSPPAITMYQNNGFFWWGFVPGLILGAGIFAVMIPQIFKR